MKRWVDSRLYQQLIGIINEGNADPHGIPTGVLTAVGAYNEISDEKRLVDFTMIIAAFEAAGMYAEHYLQRVYLNFLEALGFMRSR